MTPIAFAVMDSTLFQAEIGPLHWKSHEVFGEPALEACLPQINALLF